MSILTRVTAENTFPIGEQKVYISCELGKDWDDITLKTFARNYAEKENVQVFYAPYGTPVDDRFVKKFNEIDSVIFIVTERSLRPESRMMRYEMPLTVFKKKTILPTDENGPIMDIFKTCLEYVPEDWCVLYAEDHVYFTLMHAYTDCGRIKVLRSAMDEAYQLFSKAYEYASVYCSNHEKSMEALDSLRVTATNLAECENALGKTKDAEKHFQRAKKACSRMAEENPNQGTLKNYVKCLMSLAPVLRELGNFEEAEYCWDKASDLILELNLEYKDMELMPLTVITAIRIGEMYDRREDGKEPDREKAVANYNEAINRFQIIRLIGDMVKEDLLQEMFAVTARIAQLEFELDMPEKAEMHQTIAREVMTELAECSKKKMVEENQRKHNKIIIRRKIR